MSAPPVSQPFTLRISPDLGLPAQAVTSTIVALGGKGMGKTNLGAVLLEELSAASLRWCMLDPLGVSWGIRFAADGKRPGVPCLHLGGVRGDIPIEPDGGAAVADIVVEEPRLNVLVDFSRNGRGEMWSYGQKIRFAGAFAHRLFQRQGDQVDGRRRAPLFVCLDEAARYIPQAFPAGERDLAQCVGAWTQLVEEGRNVGIGVGLLTQRSARINKAVTELADALFAFRTVGPNSMDAILAWLGEHVEKKRIAALAEQIRALPRGRALVVSPGWLKFEGVVNIRLRRTLDSSATPEGEALPAAHGPGAVPPDLVAIRARLAAVIERQRENDPAVLKDRIRALTREVERLKDAEPLAPAAPAFDPSHLEADVRGHVENLRRAGETLSRTSDAIRADLQRILDQGLFDLRESERFFLRLADDLETAAAPSVHDGNPLTLSNLPAGRPRPMPPAPTSAPRAPVNTPEPLALVAPPARGRQGILDALAYAEWIGQADLDKDSIAFLTSSSPTSSTFTGNLAALLKDGLIAYPRQGAAQLTPAGRRAAVRPAKPPTSRELHASLLKRLPESRAALLRELIRLYPRPIAREALAAAVGVSAGSSTYTGNLAALLKLGVVVAPGRGEVAAAPLLFVEGR